MGFGFRGLDAIAAKQMAREDHSATKVRALSTKNAQRRKSALLVPAPSTPTLTMPLGNETKTTSPLGENLQGPSPVDYELELEAEFPPKMVLEMQEGVIQKVRRTIIGRTMGGRTTIKALHDCLKLHLPTSFISTTLLTRGYFEVLFTDEEGAKATWRITTVKWNGLNLSFSRYIPFDSRVQGAKALLSHSIKVQFSNLHE
jgi:hypothetical protein